MSMTKRERLAKNEVQNFLSGQGYPTYARLLDLFDLNLTKDPGVIGYMEPSRARIVINEGLDMEQVSVTVRHEILHEYLSHELRLLRHLGKNRNIAFDKLEDLSVDDLKNLRNELYSNKNFNIAADYEISNRGYTDRDKELIRNIELNGQKLRGLVTEDDHPDWVDLSVEDMYDKLIDEMKKAQEEAKKNQKDQGNNDSQGDEGNGQQGQNQQIGDQDGEQQPSNGGSQGGSGDQPKKIIIKGKFIDGQFYDQDGNVIQH